METISAQITRPPGERLSEPEMLAILHQGLAGQFARQKVLVLIPDHTRSLPLAFLFRALVEALREAKELTFLVALGTHPPLDEERLNELLAISAQERHGRYAPVRLLNHAWDDPSQLASLGRLDAQEMRTLAGGHWHASLPAEVEVRINRLALEVDHIIILGPTFPHEVAGFSGGAKYLFPGISGPEMIHATHWLGALAGVVGTIGIQETPVRRMIHAAARRLPTPVTLLALVLEGHDPCGMFLGDLYAAWRAAAELSMQRNVVWCEKPYQRVLSCAPAMYDELWTAAKAMYKLEPVVAVGGEVIIHAPHLHEVSRVHGKHIFEIGYHILPYFLENWEKYRHIPLGVLAHSTHLRGGGMLEDGIEKPNIRLTLASGISAADCARLNLGYLDPRSIQVEAWQDRAGEGVLYVPRAGEVLYRLKAAGGLENRHAG